MPYFGAWIDNNMPFLEISPKLILPNINNTFRFYIGPAINCTYIFTTASIYTLSYSGSSTVTENSWEEKDNSLMVSLNGVAGFDYFFTDKFGLGININYQIINLNNGTTSLPFDKYGIDENEVDIRGFGTNLFLNIRL
jgi:hypothetical protein